MERACSLIKCTECGKEMKVRNDYIKKHTGRCMSCQKKGNKQALKHGDYKERLYHIWQGMSQRRYKYEVSVCEEWKNYENFKEWALNNGYDSNLTIDRIDNKRGYCPSNCQWITLSENAGKDKIIFTDTECVTNYIERQRRGITQREMAQILKVSRTTIQRMEQRAKKLIGKEKM